MVKVLHQYLQKDFVKNFFIYTIGAVFLKGVSFLFIPIYTKVLTPEEFGQLELITTITTVLSILLSYGLPQLVFVEYYHLEKEEKLNYINKIISIYFIAATPVFTLLYIGLLNLELFEIKDNKLFFISLALLSSYFLFFQTIFFSVLQLEKQALKLTKFKVVAGIGVALLNILLVYYLQYGVIGILFTNFIVLILSLVIAYPKFKHEPKIKLINQDLRKNEIYAKIKKGFPYILSSLSFWMIAGIDRWIILYFLSQHEVGIYSVAYKFAVVYEPLLIGPILSIYSPYIFERFKNNNLEQKPLLVIGATILIFMFLAIISYFVAFKMINTSFHESLYLIPIMVTGFAFILLAQLFGSLMVFFNKSKLLIQNVFVSSLINILANIILIKHFGLLGAAIAFVLSNLGWFILTFIFNKRIKKQLLFGINSTEQVGISVSR